MYTVLKTSAVPGDGNHISWLSTRMASFFPHTIHYNLDVYIEQKLQSRLNRTLQF